MMMWWEIGGYPEIKPIEVERFTDDSAWVNGRRRKRLTDWNGVFPTWEEAKQHLICVAEAKVAGYRRALDGANSRLGNLKGLKPPRASSGPGEAL